MPFKGPRLTSCVTSGGFALSYETIDAEKFEHKSRLIRQWADFDLCFPTIFPDIYEEGINFSIEDIFVNQNAPLSLIFSKGINLNDQTMSGVELDASVRVIFASSPTTACKDVRAQVQAY